MKSGRTKTERKHFTISLPTACQKNRVFIDQNTGQTETRETLSYFKILDFCSLNTHFIEFYTNFKDK